MDTWVAVLTNRSSHRRNRSSYIRVEFGARLLGPALFLFYINDCPAGLTSTVRMVVDDTALYLTDRS